MAANHARGARTRSCAYVAHRAAATTEAGRYAARSLPDLAEHGVMVTHESIRRWPTKFGVDFRQKANPAPSADWRYGHLGEVLVRTRSAPHHPRRAVDQHSVTKQESIPRTKLRLSPQSSARRHNNDDI